MPSNHETTFWALDFDRCLGNVDEMYGLYGSIVQQHTHITENDMTAARQEIEASGESFDLLSYVAAQLGSAAVLQIVANEFVRVGQGRQLLHDGASELIHTLEADPVVHFGIVTYGSPDWQTLKLKASGLASYPTYITPHPDKGRIVAGWYDGSRFVVPAELGGVAAEHFVLVDDKARAFRELPDAARGYWVLTDDSLPSQKGSVPENVVKVSSLQQIATRYRTDN